MTADFCESLAKEQKKTLKKITACALAFMLCGCAGATAAAQADAGNEKAAETAEETIADPVEEITGLLKEGRLKEAVKVVNTVRITAKTDKSLTEETIAVLDNLYAYCKLNQYIGEDDFTTAVRWVEKLDRDLLPEELQKECDGIYEKYADKLGL